MFRANMKSDNRTGPLPSNEIDPHQDVEVISVGFCFRPEHLYGSDRIIRMECFPCLPVRQYKSVNSGVHLTDDEVKTECWLRDVGESR
jgi:hypothetical protein